MGTGSPPEGRRAAVDAPRDEEAVRRESQVLREPQELRDADSPEVPLEWRSRETSMDDLHRAAGAHLPDAPVPARPLPEPRSERERLVAVLPSPVVPSVVEPPAERGEAVAPPATMMTPRVAQEAAPPPEVPMTPRAEGQAPPPPVAPSREAASPPPPAVEPPSRETPSAPSRAPEQPPSRQAEPPPPPRVAVPAQPPPPGAPRRPSAAFEPPPAQPAEPPPPTRGEQRATPGERFVVSLPGPGWIFIGSTGPVDFLGREDRAEGVRFQFRLPPQNLPEGDSLELQFEQQDLQTGRRTAHTESLSLERPVARGPATPPVSPTTPRGPQVPSGSPAGDGAGTPVDQAATPAVPPADSPDFLAYIQNLVDHHEEPRAVALLEEALEDLNYSTVELIFRLAEILEQPGDTRDLRRSRLLYQRVVQDFPFSPLREPARRRIEFLDRHFFFIR